MTATGLDTANSESPVTRLSAWGTWVLMALLAALFHGLLGSYSSDFGAFEDEPAHLVTALMLRDWIQCFEFSDPQGFVEHYYLHYPKVAIGQWPPVLHGSLALWMLVFGTSGVAIAAYQTFLVSLVALTIQRVLRRPLGWAAATSGAVLYLLVPIAQQCSQSVMTETLIALLALWSALSFGRFMDTGRARWMLSFGVLAALTLLTKGTGFALAPMPVLSLVFAWRFDLLKRPALWGGAVVVAAITAPWYLATLEVSQGTWAGGASPSLEYAGYAAGQFGTWVPRLTGVLGCALVPIGIVWGWRNGGLHGRWVALTCLLPSLLSLHMLVPSSVEERHLSVMAPGWVLFTALGAGIVGRHVFTRLGSLGSTAGVAVVGLVMVLLGPPLVAKTWSGWETLGARYATAEGSRPARVLVASDPVGEGLLVVGVAFAEAERPSHMILRGSKVLGNAGWSGRDYEVRFSTVEEVEDYLRSMGVGALVVDESVRGSRHWYTHMDQLLELVELAGWQEIDSEPVVRHGEPSEGRLRVLVDPGWQELPQPELTVVDVLR